MIDAVVLEQLGVPDHRNIYDGVFKYYQLVVLGLCYKLENMMRTNIKSEAWFKYKSPVCTLSFILF